MGIASLLLGFFGLLLFLVGLGVPLGLLGLVLGVVGIRRVRVGLATNPGVAAMGIVLSLLAVAASVAMLLFLNTLFQETSDCFDKSRYPTPQDRRACVERRLHQPSPQLYHFPATQDVTAASDRG
jgi:hypothetical protein